MHSLTFLGFLLFVFIAHVSAANFWYRIAGKVTCNGRNIVHEGDNPKRQKGALVKLYYSDGAAITTEMSNCVNALTGSGRCLHRTDEQPQARIYNDGDSPTDGLSNRFYLEGII